MRFATLTLIFVLAIPVGLAILQVYLSKRESRWPGLVLPALSLLMSLIICVGNVAYSVVSTSPGGVQSVSTLPGARLTALIAFLVSNIPTVVYLTIYLAAREKARRRKEMDHMNVQDL